MTSLPVPPSVPCVSKRARFARVPGVSLRYQLRISRTRSSMTLSFCTQEKGYLLLLPCVAESRNERASDRDVILRLRWRSCYRRDAGARVAELVDALDLGSSGVTHGGSSPPSRILVPPVFRNAFS